MSIYSFRQDAYNSVDDDVEVIFMSENNLNIDIMYSKWYLTNQVYIDIGLDHGLAPNMWQAICLNLNQRRLRSRLGQGD